MLSGRCLLEYIIGTHSVTPIFPEQGSDPDVFCAGLTVALSRREVIRYQGTKQSGDISPHVQWTPVLLSEALITHGDLTWGCIPRHPILRVQGTDPGDACAGLSVALSRREVIRYQGTKQVQGRVYVLRRE